ncbi:MAG: hypothetical protein ABIS36_09605 [Chryseolinea sp.]
MRSCVFINSDPADRAIFVTALFDTSPDTVCFLADNDTHALKIMREDSIVPDYIFIELDTYGINGFNFLRRIRNIQSLSRIPVIVHCDSPGRICIDDLRTIGAFAIYPIPYNYKGMCNILNIYLNQDSINLNLN